MKVRIQSSYYQTDDFNLKTESITQSLKVGGSNVEEFKVNNIIKNVFRLDSSNGSSFYKSILDNIEDRSKISFIYIDLYDISDYIDLNTIHTFNCLISGLNLNLSNLQLVNLKDGFLDDVVISNISILEGREVNLTVIIGIK